jgi:organic hydroperoxide reductase OsmC/OhrA
MGGFPHHYTATATARPAGDVALDAERLPRLMSGPPVEFDGPGDRWSPETLIVGAVVDCFVLTFRSLASHSKLAWVSLTCDATGTLDRVDRVSQFTAFSIQASLEIPGGVSEDLARRVLTRAEQTCLIANSLKARCQLEPLIRVVATATAGEASAA